MPKETRKAIQLFQRGTGASDEVRWLFRGEKVFFLFLAHVLVKWNMRSGTWEGHLSRHF